MSVASSATATRVAAVSDLLDVRLPEVTLRALTWGDIADDARPLALLLHGFPDTAHTWRHLGPRLAAEG